jgi:hypothetical protein
VIALLATLSHARYEAMMWWLFGVACGVIIGIIGAVVWHVTGK